MKETAIIIKHLKLENGMELLLHDCSRLMTKDRWLIVILCEAWIPIDEEYWDNVTLSDKKQNQEIREMLGDRLVFRSRNERIFVDEGQKEAVLQEMTQQMSDTIIGYINRPDFPARLFKKKVQEALRKLMVQEAMSRVQARPDDE